MPATLPASTSGASSASSLLFAPAVLFLSRSADVVERSLHGERVPLADGAARCATTSRPTRSRRCPSSRTTTTRSGATPTPASGPATPRPSASMPSAPRRGGRGRPARATARVRRASTARRRKSAAGVRLVIAESFERIYRQNADNIGLFTSTDFGLVERIQAGEAIAVDELVAGRDALAAAILRSGGLLRFGQRFMRTSRPCPMSRPLRWRPHARAPCSRRSCAPCPGHRADPGASRAGRRCLRARRLALHPRVLHRHGGAHAARHLR
jgi:3-isopropylmalate/(R)-2-methylmalate dehydratase large subunit